MLSFSERLKLLESDLQATPPAFTMSVDLPFAIFRYDPSTETEHEWLVRREIRLLSRRLETSISKKVHFVSFADLYWNSIEQSEGVSEVIELEASRGFLEAEAQVGVYLSDPDWRPLSSILIEEIQKNEWHPQNDLVFLLRTGVFAPSSYRISSFLEQLMGKVNVPMVMFYPGTWRESLNYLGIRASDEPLASYRVKIYGRDA